MSTLVLVALIAVGWSILVLLFTVALMVIGTRYDRNVKR